MVRYELQSILQCLVDNINLVRCENQARYIDEQQHDEEDGYGCRGCPEGSRGCCLQD